MGELSWEDPGGDYIERAIEELGIDEDAAFRAFGDANVQGDILKGQNELVDRVMERALALRAADIGSDEG